jgi:hypothetical protein
VIEWPAARLIVTDGLNAGDQVIIDSTGLSDGLGHGLCDNSDHDRPAVDRA